MKLGWLYFALCGAFLVVNAVQIMQIRSLADVQSAVAQMAEEYPINQELAVLAKELGRIRASTILPLHVVPVPVWLLLALLQNVAPLRKRYPGFHHVCGYAMFALTLVMVVPVFAMPLLGEEMLAEPEAPFSWTNPATVFTFANASFVFAPWWMFTAWTALQHARRKDFLSHKRWILRFLATGLSVGTMRFLFIAYAATFYPKNGDVLFSGEKQAALYGATMWLGFIINLTICELYLGWQRTSKPKAA